MKKTLWPIDMVIRAPLYGPPCAPPAVWRSGRRRRLSQWCRRKIRVWEKTGGYCAYCSTVLEFHECEIDHIIPKSRGGPHSIDNLTMACRPCNRRKLALDADEYLLRLAA